MVAQAIVDGIIAACAFLPVALGFFLYYRVSGILHFAHGAIIPISGFTFLTLISNLQFPVVVAAFLSILAAMLVGALCELVLYRPLRSWDRRKLGTFVVSFGAYAVLVSILSLIFGDATQVENIFPIQAGIDILGARASTVRLIMVGAAIGAMLSTWLFLHATYRGLFLRAIASNSFLARATGVPLTWTYTWVIAVGSGLAAVTGILMTMDTGITPNAGLAPLLLGVIAVFVGGRTEFGVLLGAAILGLSQHIATIWISAKWQDTIAFVLLSLILLIRPGGLIGAHAPEIES